jgi:hypothetical protein
MHRRYLLIVLAAVAATGLLFLLHVSEEDRVLEQVEELRTLAGIHSPEGSVEVLLKSRLLGKYFAETTFYDLTNNGQRLYEVPSRQELVQHIARMRAKLASLELTVQDTEVSIEGDTARVRLRGTGQGSLRDEQGRFLEIHSIEIYLKKPEDTWLVTGARHLRNEREPQE